MFLLLYIVLTASLTKSAISTINIDNNFNNSMLFNLDGNDYATNKSVIDLINLQQNNKNLNITNVYKNQVFNWNTKLNTLELSLLPVNVICCSRLCEMFDTTANCLKCGCTCVPQNMPSYLKVFILKDNLLTELADYEFIRLKHLKELNLSNNKIKSISAKAFYGLQNLIKIVLNYNPIKNIYDYTFTPLQNLHHLEISSTQIRHFNTKTLTNITRLRKLILIENSITEIPNFFEYNFTSLAAKQIKYLNLCNNQIKSIYRNDLLSFSSLETLILGYNPLHKLDNYIIYNLTMLKELKLRQCSLDDVKENAFSSNSLKILDLERTLFYFKKGVNYFGNLPNLTDLNIGQTKIKHMALEDIIPNPLQTLKNLEYLNIIDSLLKDSYLDVYLQNMTKLTYVDITHNNIENLNKSMFQYLPKTLKTIKISFNKITRLLRYQVPDWIWLPHNGTKKILVLNDNPFNCDCDILWLKRWLTNHKGTMSNKESYICSSPNNLKGQMIQHLTSITQQTCFSVVSETFIRIYFAVTITIGIYVIVTVATLLHRFRWHARYFIFVYKNKWRNEAAANTGNFEYDAFISYCASDRKWVLENLSKFEEQESIKFCFHDRDWLGGRYIMENLISTMQASRKLVFVVSKAFCESAWCQDELQLAHTNIISRSHLDNVIIILLEELKSTNVSETLKVYLLRTYIEWPGDEDVGREQGLVLFWERFRRSLEDVNRVRDDIAAHEALAIQLQHSA